MKSYTKQPFTPCKKVTIINRNNTRNKVQIPESFNNKLTIVDNFRIPQIYSKRPLSSKPTKILNQNKFTSFESFKSRPSDKLRKIKVADPFISPSNHAATNFSAVYSTNGIPCRWQHVTTKLSLFWEQPFDTINYGSVLPLCFEGIIETAHPYKFIARQSCKELLLAQGSYPKVIPVLNKLFTFLRPAVTSNNDETFSDSCEILMILIKLVKSEANKYWHLILQPMNKRIWKPDYKEKVINLLRVIEYHGGEDAKKIIKIKVPSYVCSI